LSSVGRVVRPLYAVSAIEARLDAVEEMVTLKHDVKELRANLSKLPDVERLLSRVHANGW
jgi:DNA mismatch repair ATPase MutS